MEQFNSVVTGANSGIGLETARALCARGDRVFLVCRSEEKALSAAAAITVPGGAPPVVVIADLSQQSEVVRAANEIASKVKHVDVLVNNAGAYFPRRTENPDGVEMNLALNHLAYFRLTRELYPLLDGGRPSRVVNVASRAHRVARLDFRDLEFSERRYRPFVAYGTSKLMNIMFTRELARRAPSERVTANAVHPGVVKTGFGHDYPGLFSWLATIASPAMVSAAKGAETSIHLAISREVEGLSGGYYADAKLAKPRKKALDDEAALRLWRMSEKLCGVSFSPEKR